MQHFQFAQFTDEFNIAQHLPLGHKSRLLFIVTELSGSLLVSGGNSSPIFKLILAFAKQQSLKGGNLTFCRFKVWGVLIESLAQLCTTLRWRPVAKVKQAKKQAARRGYQKGGEGQVGIEKA